MITRQTSTYPSWVTAFVSLQRQGAVTRLAEDLGLVPDRVWPMDTDNKQPLPLLTIKTSAI